VEAYLTRPERARSGAGGLHLFVNGRPIRDRAIAVAAAQAYGSVLERGRYPRGVIYLDLPARLVDFNVHPQKIELRFAEPRAVSDALYQILTSQLARGFAAPSTAAAPRLERSLAPAPDAATPPPPHAPHLTAWLESPRAAWAKNQRAEDVQQRPMVAAAPGTPAESRDASPLAHAPTAPEPPPSEQPQTTPSSAPPSEPFYGDRGGLRPPSTLGEHVEWASLNFLAQLKQTFLICEGPAGLYVLDQHAAAERVTFDRLRRQYRERKVASQALLFPVEIELNADETEFLEENAAEFGALGMDLRLRASRWVSVHGVPRLLERLSPERLLRDLLAETMRQGGRGFSGAVDLALATLACHASLRAGDAITAAEAHALLAALDGTDFAGHCPHGRPIVSFTSYAELERKVGRR
jgi:DNA mismatch repair protein MutL